MRVFYSDVPFIDAERKASIFLAGPTPREASVPSWRPQALELLHTLRWDGFVLIPEPSENGTWPSEVDQIEWETKALNLATAILFWIPRDMEKLPGLTTNDEWGYWKGKNPRKICLGAPPNAPKTNYQRHWAEQLAIPISDTLVGVVGDAIEIARRERG